MPSYDLGTARGEVVLDFDQTGIDQANKKVGGFGTGFKKAAGLAVASLALIGAGVTAIILKGGLDRALNIQDAQKKLEGLGHSTKDIQNIMTSALSAVKGTAFGLDEAATVAATAVAAGIKPGKELTKYLGLTADAATIAGVSLNEMGAILNKAHTSGKVFTSTLNELSDRGIPVFQYLKDDLHLSGEELDKFVAKGNLSAKELDKVLYQHLAGSALASGETTRGALANVGAAFSRLGAAILSGPVSAAPALLQSIARAVDRFAAAVLPANTTLNKFITEGMTRLTKVIDGIDFTKLFADLGNFVRYVHDAITGADQATANAALPGFIGSVGKVMAAFGPVATSFANGFATIAPAIANVFDAGLGLLPPLLNSLAAVLGFVADHSGILTVILAGLVTQMILNKVQLVAAIPMQLYHNALLVASTEATRRSTTATLGLANAQRVANGEAELSNIQLSLQTTRANLLYVKQLLITGATKAYGVALLVLNGIQRAAAVAAAAFSAALDANPISLIILAIAALVAGLVLFFTQTQIGRDIWNAFVTFVTTTAQNLAKVFGPAFTAISGYVNDFVTGFKIGWGEVMTAIQPVIDYIRSTVLPIVGQVFSQGQVLAAQFAQGLADAFQTIQTVVGQVVTWFQTNVAPTINDVIGQIQAFVAQAIPAINSAWQTIQPALQPVVDFFTNVVGPNMGTILQALGIAVGVLAGILAVVLIAPLALVAAAIGVVVAVVYGLIQAFNFVVGVISTVAGVLAPIITTINSNIVGAVTAVVSFITGVVGTIQNVVGAVAGAVSAAVGGVVAFFSAVVAEITGFVTGIVTAIQSFFAPLVNYIQVNVVPVITAAVGTIVAAWNLLAAITNYVWQLIVFVVQASVGSMVVGIVTAFNFISGVVNTVMTFISGVVRTVWGAIASAVQTSLSAIQTGVTTVWNAISGFISGVLGTISGVVRTVWNSIVGFMTGVMSTLRGAITTAWNAISSFVGGIVKTIVSNAVAFFTPIVSRIGGVLSSLFGGVRGVWNNISSFVGGIVKTIVSNAVAFFSPIVGRMKSVVDGVNRGVQSGFNAVFAFIGGIKDKVVGFFAGAASWLFNAGVSVLTGFLHGLQSMFGSITGFLNNLTKQIPLHKGPPAKDLKLLEKSGQLIMTGLANGLESRREDVLKRLDSLTNAIAKRVSKGVSDKAGIFTAVGNTIKDALVQSVAGSKAAMDEKLSDIGRSIATAYDRLAKQKSAASARLKELDGELKGASKARKATLNAEIADQKAFLRALNAEPKSKSTVLKQLQIENKALDVLASQRDAVSAKLVAAQKTLSDAINGRDQLNSAVVAAVKASGDITKAVGAAVKNADGTTTTAAVTIKDMIAGLQDAVTQTARFQTAFNKLKKEGLNNTSLQQLVENFDQTGSADLANMVASTGQDQITQLNALQKQLEAAGVKLGDSTSNALYQSGINAAQGIVDGLKAKEKDLQDEMTRLANVMVAQLKKELGIKSPSTVMHKDIGLQVGAGAAGGIVASYRTVTDAMRGLVKIPQTMFAGVNPAMHTSLTSPMIPGTGASSNSYDNSQRTLIYHAAPGTAQLTAEDSLFDAMTQSRARAGW